MDIKVPLIRRSIGLGGLVSKATTKMGVKPCGGCQKREKQLNEMFRFVSTKNASR